LDEEEEVVEEKNELEPKVVGNYFEVNLYEKVHPFNQK